MRRAFWVDVVEEKDLFAFESHAPSESEGKDALPAFPRLIRERPAGIDVNPLSALAGRMGTTMPREWEEDEETNA